MKCSPSGTQPACGGRVHALDAVPEGWTHPASQRKRFRRPPSWELPLGSVAGSTPTLRGTAPGGPTGYEDLDSSHQQVLRKHYRSGQNHRNGEGWAAPGKI